MVETAGEHEESAFNSASAPVLLMSSVRSDFPGKENEHQVEPIEGNTKVGKIHVNRRLKAVLSPGSASSVRKSPRLKVWVLKFCICWLKIPVSPYSIIIEDHSLHRILFPVVVTIKMNG